jgi:hypothetical protein
MDEKMKVIADYVHNYTSGMKRIAEAAGSLAHESLEEAKTLEDLSSNSKLLGEKVLIARGVEVDPEATVFIQVRSAHTQRERQTERERQTHTHRETDRQRETDTHTERDRHRERDRHTHRVRHTERETDTHRQTGGQAVRLSVSDRYFLHDF